uniref:Uncharacterized protein n=1 Tax=Babesia motasi TaxID=237580 RepID=A0A411ADJ0_9APIC|nr:hypothetical protein [Babesia motasi]QAX27135.1 hypothetical protein [Babesia motasi]
MIDSLILICIITGYVITKIIPTLELIFSLTMSLCKEIDRVYTNITKKPIVKSYIISNNFIIIQNLVLYLLNYFSIMPYIIQDYTLSTIYLNISNKTIYNFFYKTADIYNLNIIEYVLNFN